MSSENLTFLDSLNREQLLSVKVIGSPLLINAGAGTGKTKVIASKISYLIETGVKPANILALTFTQKAADEMRNRVKEVLENVNDLQISTFHSFCNQFLADNLLETPLNSNFKTIPDIAQLVFFARNINKFELEHFQHSGQSAIADEVRKFLSRCKDESISLDDLRAYIETLQNKQVTTDSENAILNDIYKMFYAYEKFKQENNMIDFGDMLLLVYNVLTKNKKILARYQDKYRYIIVDEFQDTNYIQLKILHLIAKQYNHICVVGDDDQSIYRFRGAYVTNIKEFKNLFPDYKEITLYENYRSTGNILGVANDVIINNPDRQVKYLKNINEIGQKVKVIECNNEITQSKFIVEKIEQLIKLKCPLKEIAILTRSKNSGIPLANELYKKQIPFEFIGKPDYFFKPVVKDLICLLKIVDNPVASNVEMVRILERDVFCLKRTDVAKFSNLAHAKMCGIYEAFQFIDEINIDMDRFQVIKKSIDSLISNKNKLSVKDLVYEILFNHNFYQYELQFNNIENISYLNMFYKFVEEFEYLYPQGELTDFISYLDYSSEFGLEEEIEDRDSIKIMTVHAAKGKEFDNVFIIDALERKFPSIYRTDRFEIPPLLLKGTRSSYKDREVHIQEERRLFYVAVTRAKKQLTITYPRRFSNNITDSQPSRFLTEIKYHSNSYIDFQNVEKNNLIEPLDRNDQELSILRDLVTDIRTDKFLDAIHKILLIAKNRSADVYKILNNISVPNYVELEENIRRDLNYSQVLKSELEFSASQFSTYERCPRIYQYHYIYKIPSKPKPYFDFGGTVHKVIEEISRRMRSGEMVNSQLVSEILERLWNPQGFESRLEEKQSLEEISQILERFLIELRDNGAEILDLEKNFTIQIDDYLVKGVIDRVDSNGNDFVIIDYKTSKESSGAKQALEDIQLVLYCIAAKKLYGKTPKLVGWWFLRHNKKIMVQISQENTENVKNKIGQIVSSIRNGDFHPKPGWICKNCDYKLVCNDAKY